MSADNPPQVILINRVLAYNIPGKVTGLSGASYGTSYHEPAYGGHVCRMNLEQWRACRQDVTNGGHVRHSLWEVDFELPDLKSENPVTEIAVTAESLAEVTNYRQLLNIAKKAGVENADDISSTVGLREAILAKQAA